MAGGAILGDNILIYGAINWPIRDVRRRIKILAASLFKFS